MDQPKIVHSFIAHCEQRTARTWYSADVPKGSLLLRTLPDSTFTTEVTCKCPRQCVPTRKRPDVRQTHTRIRISSDLVRVA